MKKKILSIAFIVSFTAIVVGNILSNSDKKELIDLSVISNVEALAEGEGSTHTCIISPESFCTYTYVDTQGKTKTMTLYGYAYI